MQRVIRCCAVVLCSLAFLTGRLAAQEHPGGEHPKGEHPKGEHPKGEHPKGEQPKGEHPGGEHPGSAPPNEHHKSQEMFVGDWEATAKEWTDPTQPPKETKATCKNTLILNGRFLQMEYKGEMMGQSFEGFGLSGYDTAKKKHTMVWMDTMATQMMNSEGECTDGCKTTTLMGEMPGGMKSRSVTKVVSPTEHVFEMYMTGPDGKEIKMFEIVYKKK